MRLLRTAFALAGLSLLAGCAVYEPYPAYPGYGYAPPVAVAPPPVYGSIGIYEGWGPGWRGRGHGGWHHRHWR